MPFVAIRQNRKTGSKLKQTCMFLLKHRSVWQTLFGCQKENKTSDHCRCALLVKCHIVALGGLRRFSESLTKGGLWDPLPRGVGWHPSISYQDLHPLKVACLPRVHKAFQNYLQHTLCEKTLNKMIGHRSGFCAIGPGHLDISVIRGRENSCVMNVILNNTANDSGIESNTERSSLKGARQSFRRKSA